MIRFFKISLKALQRFKTAAILNLLGLALAFTAFLVIVLHTWNEYNYDNYHPNKEHIFKVEFLRDNNTWEDGYARVLSNTSFPDPRKSGLTVFSWITHLGRGCRCLRAPIPENWCIMRR